MKLKNLWHSVVGWLDSSQIANYQTHTKKDGVQLDWQRSIPFIVFHLACLAVFAVGWSPVALGVMVALYFVRMFAITGFYHRYFSHKSFETSRPVQFVMAIVGNAAVQRGPIWWASHHRHHHKYSDTELDNHSPVQQGFLWSHLGWIFSSHNIPSRADTVKDLMKYRELRFMDRFDWMVPVMFAVAIFFTGRYLEAYYPGLHTNGAQLLVWGFFVSTTLLFHGTFFINSLAHVWGRTRYKTTDTSRNNFLLAIITLGEGWHNNHHHYPNSVRQGFYWWEIDISFYLLKLMEKAGLVWNLRPVPQEKLLENRAA